MFLVLSMSSLILMISIIMILISSTISKKTFIDREKSSAFECGFDPKSSPRLPFSLQFFLIAIIFLIFDIEIVLLIPIISILKISKFSVFMMISSFFIIVLLLGLFHEWNQGSLQWAI